MDYQDLQILSHLGEHLHFTKTSQAFYLSPSAITRRVQLIEEELGVTIFNRHNRYVEITQAGKHVLAFAHNVIHGYQDLKDCLSTTTQFEDKLRLYASVTASTGVLPNFLARYKNENPKIELNLETGPVSHVQEKLKSKEADIGVMPIYKTISPIFSYRQIMDVPLVMICQKSKRISKVDFQKHYFLIPHSGVSRDILNDWLNEQGIGLLNSQEMQDFEAILALVSAGYGVGIIPKIVWEQSGLKALISFVECKPSLPSLKIGVFCLKKRRNLPHISSFFNIV